MTTLCTNCINFDIKELTNELRRGQIGHKQPVIDPLANTNDVEQTKLWGFQVVLVEQGARLGCVFCSLLLETVGSDHITAAKQHLKENCWIHLRPQYAPRKAGTPRVTHVEVFVDQKNTRESSYHGKIFLYADEGSPGAMAVAGRYLGNNPASSSHFQWLRQQLDECVHRHTSTCRKIITDASRDPEFAQLPTRLLDVSSDPPRLVESSGLTDGNVGLYVILSYCWGESVPLRTTRSTLDKMKVAIPLESMPQTIRDAAVITKSLGMKYLWADSLCIVQDDKNDWATESSMMGQYYSSAYLCISASGAKQSSEGCFFPRPPNPVPILLPYFDTKGVLRGKICARAAPPSFYDTCQKSTLFSRGWVVQERLLSRRIVYFAKGRTFFECQLRTVAEDGEMINRAEDERAQEYDSIEFQTRKTHFGSITEDNSWYDAVQNFSLCDLSFQTDKLAAVQGLARQLAERQAKWEARPVRSALEVLFPAPSALEIYFHYASGIWLSDVWRGLLWRADGEVQRQNSILGFPSWSWAAIRTPVIYSAWVLNRSPRQMLEILAPLCLPGTQTDWKPDDEQTLKKIARVNQVPDDGMPTLPHIRKWLYTQKDPDGNLVAASSADAPSESTLARLWRKFKKGLKEIDESDPSDFQDGRGPRKRVFYDRLSEMHSEGKQLSERVHAIKNRYFYSQDDEDVIPFLYRLQEQLILVDSCLLPPRTVKDNSEAVWSLDNQLLRLRVRGLTRNARRGPSAALSTSQKSFIISKDQKMGSLTANFTNFCPIMPESGAAGSDEHIGWGSFEEPETTELLAEPVLCLLVSVLDEEEGPILRNVSGLVLRGPKVNEQEGYVLFLRKAPGGNEEQYVRAGMGCITSKPWCDEMMSEEAVRKEIALV